MPRYTGSAVLIAGALLGAHCSTQPEASAPAAESGAVAASTPAAAAPSAPVAPSAPNTVSAATIPQPAAPAAAMPTNPTTAAVAGSGSEAAGAGGPAAAGEPAASTTAQAGTAGSADAAAGSGSQVTPVPMPQTGKGVGTTAQRTGTLSAMFKVTEVPPGIEAHKCVVVELPNLAPGWVDRIHAKMSGGSHHLIVDRVAPETPLLTQAQDCVPTMGSDQTRLWLAQQPDSKLALPEGVAFPIAAHERVFLQLHYFNSGSKNTEVSSNVELHLLADSATPIEAKSLFTGSTAISLLPQQMSTTSFFMEPSATGAPVRHVFAVSSHTHKLAVRTTIERVAAEDAPESKPIHESTDWAEPPLTVFDKPLEFKGDDGLRLICRYMNTTNRTVSFGTATTDEMCFMWMYYFER